MLGNERGREVGEDELPVMLWRLLSLVARRSLRAQRIPCTGILLHWIFFHNMRLVTHDMIQSHKAESKLQPVLTYRCYCQKKKKNETRFSPTNTDQTVIQKSLILITHLIASL